MNQSEAKIPAPEIVSKNQTPRAKHAVEQAVKESIEEQNKMIDRAKSEALQNQDLELARRRVKI